MGFFDDPLGTISHAARGTVRSAERAAGMRDTASDQQAAQAQADASAAEAARWQSMTEPERQEAIRQQQIGKGPTPLEQWSGVMPTGYNLGGNPDQANQYAAQAQQTGQDAQNALNSFGQQSVGAGYEFGQQIAGAGANALQTGQQLGTGAQQTGQQLGGQAQDMGQRLGGDVAAFGAQQAGTLGGMGQQFLGEGAQAGGRQAANLDFGAVNRDLGQANPNFRSSDQALNRAGALGSQLTGLESTEGPSAAQAQLQAGLNQSQASNLAMARSGRGFGGSAAAQFGAQAQNAAAGQNAVNQSAALRAQETAAWRARQAQNLGAAAGIQTNIGGQQTGQEALAAQTALGRAGIGMNQQQLGAQTALQQQQQNDAMTQGLYGLGVNAQQAGGQLGLQGLMGGAGIAQQGMGQNIAAQQTGIGQNIGAQQTGQQQNIGALGQAADTQLGGLAQGGQLINAGAMTGLTAQQQALAAQQQQVANQMAYGNQMINLRGQDNQATQNYAAIDAEADAASNARMDSYISAAASAAGMLAMSDRDKKKDIEPANQEILVPPLAPEKPFDPYAQGVGISGPNQAQGQASMGAANAAGAQAQGQNAAADRDAMFAKFGGAMQGFGKDIGKGGAPQFSMPMDYQLQDVGVPQAMMPQLSDEREKYSVSDEDAKEAIDKTPGYSFRYKDPEAMGADEGLQFGIMAQDLEKTPAGRSVVKKQPDGTRMVDTPKLALMEAGAMNALAKEVAELKAMVGKKGKRAA